VRRNPAPGRAREADGSQPGPARYFRQPPVGELAALRRSDMDLAANLARVSRQLTEVRGAGLAFAAPKSDAGRRVVSLRFRELSSRC